MCCSSTCCCFRHRDPDQYWQIKNDKEIWELIELEKKKKRRTHRVLLLGTGGGGKTTFLNQMKIILNGEDAFSDDARSKYHKAILENIFIGIKILLLQMEEMHIKFEKASNSSVGAAVKQMEFQDCYNQQKMEFSRDYVVKIRGLWKDEGVQRCYERRNEFYFQDSVKYFLDRLDDIVAPNYRPSNMDILYARVETRSAYQSVFHPSKQSKDLSMVLIDVGGQRELRDNWLPLFDDVTSIIFITSLSEFDQTLAEDSEVNRTAESLFLFKSVLKNDVLKKIPIILFLNKKDLLEEKLNSKEKRDQFKAYFPDFDETNEQLRAEAERTGERLEALFLRQLYLQQRDNANAERGIPPVIESKARDVFAHITQATDKRNIEKIWADIKEIILSGVIGDLNL